MKTFLSLLLSLLTLSAGAAQLPSQVDTSLLNEVEAAQDRGLSWLVKQQEPDGAWRHHPAITALAATALLRSGKTLTADQQTAVDKAIQFILSNVKTNGAIYGGGDSDKYPNYSTAICLMALQATGNAKHTDVMRAARKFLLNSQFDEGENVKESDASYGGIGYGKRQRPDLSNSQWALEALRLTESLETRSEESPHQPSKLHWKKAIAFLQRCQNLPASNDQPWAKNTRQEDLGGFVYMPGASMADEEPAKDDKSPLRSYGSMSYAGLKSYIYAELKKDDPRVKAAIDWLKHNYTLDENPGMGPQGLYYYFQTVAKALTVYGEDTFKDAAGKTHDWRYEMMKKLVNLQTIDKDGGFWMNKNNRWFENDPVLCTSYSLIALEILQARRYP